MLSDYENWTTSSLPEWVSCQINEMLLQCIPYDLSGISNIMSYDHYNVYDSVTRRLSKQNKTIWHLHRHVLLKLFIYPPWIGRSFKIYLSNCLGVCLSRIFGLCLGTYVGLNLMKRWWNVVRVDYVIKNQAQWIVFARYHGNRLSDGVIMTSLLYSSCCSAQLSIMFVSRFWSQPTQYKPTTAQQANFDAIEVRSCSEQKALVIVLNFKMKGCYSRFNFHVMDYCQ